jgi:DNA-binding transcriptional LysR family regulator
LSETLRHRVPLRTRNFVVLTAQAGSISEAARRLQISKSVASERLAEIERSIGATLMRRSTRKLMLTEDGFAFLERAK